MAACRVLTFASSRGGGCRWFAAAGAAAGVAGKASDERLASCVASTHPRMMPKHIPATANATDSAFMDRLILMPEDGQVITDAAPESDEQGVADKCMAD